MFSDQLESHYGADAADSNSDIKKRGTKEGKVICNPFSKCSWKLYHVADWMLLFGEGCAASSATSISILLYYNPHNCAGLCIFLLMDYIIVYL